MCGIFGQYNPRGATPALIERMAHVLAHRGPDGHGMYHQGNLAFGATRLAIIDLAAGVQPVFNENRQIAVVFNGEIYNHLALRDTLQTQGHIFATHTDTEVIVHGYETWGLDLLERLGGMFALALWDEPNQRLVMARDRFGEKPFYYTQVGEEFLFASEIKALFEYPGLKRAVNHEALVQYLALGYVAPPLTMFEGIHKLAHGEVLILDQGTLNRQRYWTPRMDTPRQLSYTDAVAQTRQRLTETVTMQLMSDVPIGAFLSGGIDSSAVTALMSRASQQPIRTFTVGFDFAPGSPADTKFNVDVRYAELVAKHLGTQHHVIMTKQDQSLAELLPHLIYALDEPILQPSIIQTAYVAALARQTGVPVLLSGNAGDELFLGYPHFQTDQILARYLRMPKLIRTTILTPLFERLWDRCHPIHKMAQKSRASEPADRYMGWLRAMDYSTVARLLDKPESRIQASIHSLLLPLLEKPTTKHFADRIAFASMLLSVPENSNVREDKMAMLSSVETRSPLLDYRLVEFAWSLPLEHKLRRGDFKAILKDAIADLVPPQVLTRKKWGFFAPASEWLRGPLRPLVDAYLSPDNVKAVGYFQPAVVSKLVEDHMERRSYNLWSVWSLLTFHLWHALYIDGSLKLTHKLSPAELVGAVS